MQPLQPNLEVPWDGRHVLMREDRFRGSGKDSNWANREDRVMGEGNP